MIYLLRFDFVVIRHVAAVVDEIQDALKYPRSRILWPKQKDDISMVDEGFFNLHHLPRCVPVFSQGLREY
ncbi:MAG: hypothetical protein ACK55Z_14610 [bacterium]